VRWNLYVAALAASWGVISVIVAHVDLSATVLVFWRVAIAAVTVTAACAVVGRADLLRVPSQRRLMVAVGVVLAVHWYLFFETIKLSSVAVAVLTVYTAPVFLALLAPLFLPEQRSRVALVALIPAGAGLVLMSAWGSGGTHARPLAIACGIGAALTYALLVIGTKSLRARMGPVTITAWSYGIAALALAPFLTTAGRVIPQGSEIFYVLLLGVVFTALSGYIYVGLLGHVTAQAVGILAYLEPVSAAILAWALLGQPLGWQVLLGGALVVAAGVVIVLREPVETEVRIAG
jgi:drug/metabolite transporter (DMT)-like permease